MCPTHLNLQYLQKINVISYEHKKNNNMAAPQNI